MDMQQPVPIDPIYQGYSKTLYRITGEESMDDVMDILTADTSANNSSAVTTAVSNLGSDSSAATTAMASGGVQAGKTGFINFPIDGNAGFILGVDATDGVAKFNIGDGTSGAYFAWDGHKLLVTGNATSQIQFFDVSGNQTTSLNGLGMALTTATGSAVLSVQGTITVGTNSGQGIFGNLYPVGNHLYDLGATTRQWNNIYCVTLTQSSDIRIKENVGTISYGLGDVLAMEPIVYSLYGERRIGFSAQALHKLVPEVTRNAEEGTPVGSASVIYSDIIPVLVKAIQELSEKVDRLEKGNFNNVK